MVRGLFISTLISLTGFLAVDATGMDEAALRADAQKIFKEKVGPFVEKYCARCHGSRAKAGINLQSAVKNPSGESAVRQFKKAAAKVKGRKEVSNDIRKYLQAKKFREELPKYFERIKKQAGVRILLN